MHERLSLHHARIARGIDLATIAAATALSPSVVSRIDEGRFGELPPGLYARAYVRAFAEAVGVPADVALADLAALLPAAPDPLPGLRELAPPSPFESFKAFMATQTGPLTAVHGLSVRRVAASMIDAALLLAIGAVMITLASWTCGVELRLLLEEAGAALALMFSVPVGLYFILLEAVGHRTVGAALCGTAKPTRTVFRITRAQWMFTPDRPRRCTSA